MSAARTPLLLAAVCFALRLAFLGRYPEGWDSVNFILALRRYDVVEGQPHFPGYPVYVFAGRLFHLFLRDEVTALVVAGCLFSSLAIVPLYRLASRLYSPRVALGAGLLFIVNPLIFLEAEKVFSDAFALLFLLAAADFTEEASRLATHAPRAAARAGYLAGLAAGLLLGVRVSALPFLLSAAVWLLWQSRRSAGSARPLWTAVHGLIHGTGAWLIPLLALTGVQPLMQAGTEHMRGHFTQWGETAVTDRDLGTRLLAFLWDLGPNGLGTWWPDTPSARRLTTLLVLLALVRCAVRFRRDEATHFLLVFTLPYAAWVFLGQNLQNPRHVLPLVALLLPALAAGLLSPPPPARAGYPLAGGPLSLSPSLSPSRIARRWSPVARPLLFAALVVGWAATALPLAQENRWSPPTRIALIAYIRERYDPRHTAVACWNSTRIFDYAAPEWAARVVPSVEEAVRLAGPRGTALVISDLPDFAAIRQRWHLRPLRPFRRSRYVHNYLHEVALFECFGR